MSTTLLTAVPVEASAPGWDQFHSLPSVMCLSAPLMENFDGTSWVASGTLITGNMLDPCWNSNPDVNTGSPWPLNGFLAVMPLPVAMVPLSDLTGW